MFHARTTIRRPSENNFFRVSREQRLVYAGIFERMGAGIASGYDSVKNFGGKVLSVPILATRVIFAPITIPSKLIIGGAKAGWNLGLKKVLHGIEWSAGAGKEIGGGLKDTVKGPAWTLGGACGYHVKSYLWDLPGAIKDFVLNSPENVKKTGGALKGTPLRMWESMKMMAGNTRSEVKNVLKSIPKLEMFSTVKASRDALKKIFVDPAKHTLSPLAGHWVDEVGKVGKPIVNPYWNYAKISVPRPGKWIPEVWTSAGPGLSRIGNAHKNTFKFKWLEEFEKKWKIPTAEEKKAAEEAAAKGGVEKKPEKKEKKKEEAHAPAHAPDAGHGNGHGHAAPDAHGHAPAH